MPPDKRRAPPGGSGASSKIIAAVNSDGSDLTAQAPKNQAFLRRRCDYARDAVFETFGYQHARAIDYDGFIDRKPNLAPVWWRAAP